MWRSLVCQAFGCIGGTALYAVVETSASGHAPLPLKPRTVPSLAECRPEMSGVNLIYILTTALS